MPEFPKDKKSFTPTEVGILIESFKNDIQSIAEDLSSVKKDVHSLKEDMTQVKSDLTAVKDAVRINVPNLTNRVAKLEAKVGR